MNLFNCFGNKKKVQVQNEIFDLMDQDGDNKITLAELQIVAKYVHAADVQRAKSYWETLKLTQPVDHVTKIVGTKNVYKRHLKEMYPRVQPDVWCNNILPDLKRAEINRLKSSF